MWLDDPQSAIYIYVLVSNRSPVSNRSFAAKNVDFRLLFFKHNGILGFMRNNVQRKSKKMMNSSW